MSTQETMRLLMILIIFLLVLIPFGTPQDNVPIVPAVYVFGDSTVDPGNMIGIRDPIYGNNIADSMASYLGIPIVPGYISIYRDHSKMSNATGVNYAYPDAGILPETPYPGKNIFEEDWSFDGQLSKFNQTLRNDLPQIMDQEELLYHMSHSIFIVSFGNNDFMANYLPPSNGTFSTLLPETFGKVLLDAFSIRLTALYKLGARKMVVNNVWPLGCTPHYIKSSDALDSCNMTVNRYLLPYSTGIPGMLSGLASSLAGSSFSNSDNFEFVRDLKKNPATYGITDTTGQCRGTNCEHFLYIDDVRTTEAANRVFAEKCFKGSLCSPVNLIGLVNGPPGHA